MPPRYQEIAHVRLRLPAPSDCVRSGSGGPLTGIRFLPSQFSDTSGMMLEPARTESVQNIGREVLE